MSKSISRLVFCSKIKSYEDALQILFVNSQKIPKLKSGFWEDRYFLIDVSGDNQDRRRTMETAIQEWTDTLEEYGKEIARKMKEEGIGGKQEILNSPLGKVDLTFEDLSNYPWLQTPTQKKGIISTVLKKSLIEYARESELLKMLMKKKNLIGILSDKDMSIIEPWAQIGICNVCKTYELISTTKGSRPKRCPHCKRKNLTTTIYGFDEEFQKHFIHNKVLPIFCVTYINSRAKKNIAKPLKLKDEQGKDKGDIDVYIKATNTGIECKLSLEHDPAPTQFDNHYDEILKDLKNYIDYGVKNLIVITNIEEHRAAVLKKKLLEGLNLDSETTLRIIHRSVPLLLETLSKEAESIKEYL